MQDVLDQVVTLRSDLRRLLTTVDKLIDRLTPPEQQGDPEGWGPFLRAWRDEYGAEHVTTTTLLAMAVRRGCVPGPRSAATGLGAAVAFGVLLSRRSNEQREFVRFKSGDIGWKLVLGRI